MNAGTIAALGAVALLATRRAGRPAVVDPVTGININSMEAGGDNAASINRNVESQFSPGYDPLADPNRPQVTGTTGNSVNDWFDATIAANQAKQAAPIGPLFDATNAREIVARQSNVSNPYTEVGGSYPRMINGVEVANDNQREHLSHAWEDAHK